MERRYVKLIEVFLLILNCVPTCWLSYIFYSRIYTIWNIDKYFISVIIINILYGYLLLIYLLFKGAYEIGKSCDKENN